jgi:hypothetical protein
MISTAILGPAKLQHHAGVFSMETRQYSRSAETRLATFYDRLSKLGVKVAANEISKALIERLGEARRRESEQSQAFEKVRQRWPTR